MECKKTYDHLKPIVSPRSPLHGAELHVKWELLHVDVAHGHVDAVAEPRHLPSVAHDDVRVDHRRPVVRVSATTKQSVKKNKSHMRRKLDKDSHGMDFPNQKPNGSPKRRWRIEFDAYWED